jgi:NADH:ubiquinone oxidoreductase subunit 4 (subunit M)
MNIITSLFELNLLSIILLLPLFSIILIYLFSYLNDKIIHEIALILSSLSFVLSIVLLLLLDKSNPDFQFQTNLFLVPSLNFSVLLGIDGISIYFIVLTNLCIYLCILSISIPQTKLYEFLMYLFLLQWGCNCAFSVLDLLGFFIFFEATLIHIYLIILI